MSDQEPRKLSNCMNRLMCRAHCHSCAAIWVCQHDPHEALKFF